MRAQALRLIAATVIASAASAALIGGCSDSRLDVASSSSGASSGGPAACSTPQTGCTCDTAGAIVGCGRVTRKIGDYVTCSNGLMACENGRWGACEGDQVTTKRVASDGLRTQGLGTPTTCSNPCSPACSTVSDTPTGLDAGAESGVVVTDAGLQLAPVSQIPSTCTALSITPNSAPGKDIEISGPGPWQLQYTASLLPAGCYTGSFQPLWSVDKFDVADISASGRLSVISPVAGELKIAAYAGGLVSNIVATNVTVKRVTTSSVNPPPLAITAASFPPVTAATPADNVTVIYPYERTMLPLGLPAPLLQWRTPTAATGIQVSLRYPATGAPIFNSAELRTEKIAFPVPLLSAKERATIPQADWAAFEQTVNRNRAVSGDLGAIVLRRVVGGIARAETIVNVHFAPTQLKGRIYYNTYGTSLVQNYNGAQQSLGGAFPNNKFGAATLQLQMGDSAPTVVAGTASDCIVCHSASNDGQLLISTHIGGYNNRKFVFPGATASGTAYGDYKFVFPGIHPNKNRVMTSAGGHSGDSKSQLFDADGNAVGGGSQPADLQAAYPAFSNTGAGAGQVAFTFRGGTPAPLASPSSGPTSGDGKTLSMMSFDGNNVFSNFRNLYTSPSNRIAWWPAFLPSADNGVVFHLERRSNGRDPGGTREDSENGSRTSGATAEVWWVNTTGAPVGQRLDRLNGYNPGGATGYLPTAANLHAGVGGNPDFYEQVYNYEPTVLPVSRGGFSWVTFTSRRLYGNVATVGPYDSDPRYVNISVNPTTKKLWISALSANPAPGTDPSYPAFYVPGQELVSGNMRGYFVLDACRNPGPKVPANECETNLDCCAGSVCALDRPVSNPAKRYCISSAANVCKQDGNSCQQDAECCNFSTGVRCASGTCALPPPIFNSATFDREFASTCGAGTRTQWALYQWKSTIPAGTSITFQAQTRASNADPWGAAVAVGTSGADANSWTSGPQTISQALTAAGQQPGLTQVRIRATFNVGSPPNASPALREWRLGFDCIPNE